MKLTLKNGVSAEMEVIIRIEKDGYCAERYMSLEQMLYDMDGTTDKAVDEMCKEIEQMREERENDGTYGIAEAPNCSRYEDDDRV